jgi:hypothetical protein
MLDYRAPEADLPMDAVFYVTKSAQMVEAFAGVDSACAIRPGNLVAALRSAFGSERDSGMPPNPIQRLQSRRIPLPDTITDDGKDVIRRCHGATGSRSGSGSCLGATGSGSSGSGSGTVVGTGDSKGSTMIVRSGLPICIRALSYFPAQ